MFFQKKDPSGVNTRQIDSLIAAGTELLGDLRFKGGLRLEGRVCGNIAGLPGETAVLMIGPQGSVEGDIQVSHLIVEGAVHGAITVEQGVELGGTARVLGNMNYGSIEMHPGAIFEGHMISHKTPLLVHETIVNPKPESPNELTAPAE